MNRLFSLLILAASQALGLENPIPTAFPADRYEKLAQSSPFALATPVVPVAAPQVGFAASWFLTAAGRDPQGQDFVTIKAQDGSVYFSLIGHETNIETGVSLSSIDWSDTFRKTTAIIKKGIDTAKVEFLKEDTMMPAQPAVPKPALPGGAMPPVTLRTGANGIGGQPQVPVVQNRISLPRPANVPVVTQPPPVVQPGQPAAAGENRRRIRNVPNPAQ